MGHLHGPKQFHASTADRAAPGASTRDFWHLQLHTASGICGVVFMGHRCAIGAVQSGLRCSVYCGGDPLHEVQNRSGGSLVACILWRGVVTMAKKGAQWVAICSMRVLKVL